MTTNKLIEHPSKYKVHAVFTPTTPARVTFVERSGLNDKLVSAMSTPGKQVVVYGHSGSGKTTLLVNKLHQLYERHITSRCMKGMTFEQLVLDAFDQLSPFYESERSKSTKLEQGGTVEAEYMGIKAQLKSAAIRDHTRRESRILPPQLTPQALGRFLGVAHSCWVIEDFHKVDESEKVRLSQLMKIFMDLADDYPDVKIIAIGAVDTARQVVQYDDEMRNRVAEIHVPLMNATEIEYIIEKGERALNLSFKSSTKRSIARYSGGLASVCHHLCLNMCNAAELHETSPQRIDMSERELEEALAQYLDEASDSLKSVFDTAFRPRRKAKYDNARLIVRALCAHEDGATKIEVLSEIRKHERDYPASNFDYFADKLQTEDYGGILRHDPVSGRYAFSDPIYRVFALAYFRNRKGNVQIQGGDWTQLLEGVRVELLQQLSSRLLIKFEK